MQIKLIAFDFDGTMVDTERLTLPYFIQFVEGEYGVRISYDAWVAKYHGKSGQSLLDELNADYDQEIEWLPFVERHNKQLPEIFKSGLDLAPGLAPVLEALWRGEVPFCICTNSQKARNDIAIASIRMDAAIREHLKLTYFSGVEEGRKSKPAPDVYADAAKYHKVDPAHAVAIEDTVTGTQAAVAAGFTCIGYVGLSDHPEATQEKLKLAGAKHVIRHWDEFLPLLATL